jgi:secreted trypsin-like serine protease
VEQHTNATPPLHVDVQLHRPGSVNLVPSSSDKVHQIHSIAQIYEHNNYDHDKNINDMALLRLSSPLNMTSGNLKPICLPTSTTVQSPDNINMIAVGWGVTSMSSDTASPVLRQVTVQSIASTVSSCQSAIYNSQLQFCVGLQSGGKGNTSI